MIWAISNRYLGDHGGLVAKKNFPLGVWLQVFGRKLNKENPGFNRKTLKAHCVKKSFTFWILKKISKIIRKILLNTAIFEI